MNTRSPRYPRLLLPGAQTTLREVAPGLLVGDASAYRHLVETTLVRPSAVIDLTRSSSSSRLEHDPAFRGAYMPLPFADGEPFPPKALDRIHRLVLFSMPRGPVLIHCQAGLSRSASAAYAMLRTIFGLSVEEADARVRIVSDYPLARTLESAEKWARHKNQALQRRG